MDWTSIASFVQAVGVPVALLLLLFHYATSKLIPELQKERSEAIKAFQEEAQKERESHERSVERVVQSGLERDRAWMEMLKDLVSTKV